MAGNIWGEKLRKSVFASLDSSSHFLSMIFGIFGKFRIDIGVQIFCDIFFEMKKILKIFLGNFGNFQNNFIEGLTKPQD